MSPFQPPLPGAGVPRVHWGQLYGSSLALTLSRAARAHSGLVLVVTTDTPAAQRLDDELRFFLAGSDDELPLHGFPDHETLPYDAFSPHEDIISQRLATLYRLPEARRGLLVVPVATLMHRLPPTHYLGAHSLMLDRGETLDIEPLRTRLQAGGYRCVSQVTEHGEYAVRGGLIDLYPMGSERPFRIDLLGDEIDSIRTFDPESQRSIDAVDRIRLLPAREFPMGEEDIQRFRQHYRATFAGDPQESPIYRDISRGVPPPGIEYFLPLFFPQTATLFDYLPDNVMLVSMEGAEAAAEHFWAEVEGRYEQRRHDRTWPALEPSSLFVPPDALRRLTDPFPGILARPTKTDEGADHYNFATRAPANVLVNRHTADPISLLASYLGEYPGRVLLVAETPGRREMLLELLRHDDIYPTPVADWSAFIAGEGRLAVTVAPLDHGLTIDEPHLSVIAESQLFGEQVMQRRRRKARARDNEAVIRNLTELNIGAPVVHEDHGVGRYRGLETLTVGGITTEFLLLEYAGGDKLYVPVSSLHLISRYTGAAPEEAPLHKLGAEQWQRARRRAAERVRDVAAELLDIYARREAATGVAIPPPDDQYAAFAAAFPFEETPDQERAIDEVLKDMTAIRPMDRLVCGDVGFGKTEVAMRASFLAVQNNAQVAVLVPTTLLAQQHFENFRDRFAELPVRIEMLSRFRSKAEQTDIIRDIGGGKIDIVIGTHKLLDAKIKFKRLGLVILDEEHRFGVRQKERLKALRAEVDVLTLTATPIPRTLNMALSGLREISLITTPPSERLAIKTFVRQWDDGLIREACLREIMRGGQVYFVHNEVQSIAKIAAKVEKLLPEATVRIAHGQMRERELEHVMLDFYHQRFNVLVCTTIIESGIDVPNANTIIIHRADKLGLAQLHQLRGRVGRSHHRAYAYLLVPPPGAMTADAVKRLEAVESLEQLGAGFMLATHDLEIRGAGELLGDEQSGQIQEIGFTLYMDLLERAVAALKAGQEPALDQPLQHGAEIDLHLPALIPEDYLPDVHARLVMYKRIASARSADELDELQVEMIDRFGLLPAPAKTLFLVTTLKLRAQALGIEKIEAGPAGGRLVFGPQPKVDPEKLIGLVQQSPSRYRFDGEHKLRFSLPLEDPDARLAAVTELLDTFGSH